MASGKGDASEPQNVVEFVTLDDDGDAAEMDPALDEFDMWNHQQRVVAVGSAASENREVISALQKSFLDALNTESDVNAAAAQALLGLKASQRSGTPPSPDSKPSAMPSSPIPETPSSQFMTMYDDEDEQGMDRQLDEFDLWAQQQVMATDSLPEGRKQAITSLQSLFLDALDGGADLNGAAAEALRRLLSSTPAAASGTSEDQPSPVSTQRAGKMSPAPCSAEAKGRALAAFQALFFSELQKRGDATVAAAAALGRVSSAKGSAIGKQEALKAWASMLANQVGHSGDASGAVAAVLLKMGRAGKAKT